MADHQAITAVCQAVLGLLKANYKAELFNDQELEFKVCQAAELAERTPGAPAGITLYLFAANPAFGPRNLAGPFSPPRVQRTSAFQLDLHFLLTAWAEDVDLALALTGWMVRLLHDNPILSASLLNIAVPASFQPDETVEIVPSDLRVEDILSIWQKAVNKPYRLSIPYIARAVAIEAITT